MLGIFTVTFVALGLVINNATFSLYRRSQEHNNMNGSYRHPSGPYMQSGPHMNQFPATPGLAYNQHPQGYVGWQGQPGLMENQQQQRLEYQKIPSKEYGTRSRSRSPEKKKLMIA